MTETIFTGKQIKELAAYQVLILFGTGYAKFPGLFEDFFIGNCPGYTGYG
jgi:hypothetical protein